MLLVRGKGKLRIDLEADPCSSSFFLPLGCTGPYVSLFGLVVLVFQGCFANVTRSRREIAPEEVEGEDLEEASYAPVSNDSVSHAGSSASRSQTDSLPWFLQENIIEIDPPVASASASASASRPPPSVPLEDPTALALPDNLPATLRLLHTHLTKGSSSGLLHKPSFTDLEDGETPPSPVVFVHAAPLQDGLSWCDWITIVTVRENTGGGINGIVARDIGDLLSRVGPPSFEGGSAGGRTKAERGLDQILGPNERLSGSKDAYGPSSTQRLGRMSKEGMESEESQIWPDRESPTQWARQKEALAAKYSSWKPLKILSRETQSGLRILHSSDPQKWTASVLSSHFKVSVEAVRRILKARPERWGGDADDKGLRRMGDKGSEPERWKREEEEVERLRRSLGRDDVGEEDEVGLEEDLQQADEAAPAPLTGVAPSTLDVRSLGKPRYSVRFEGLPAASASTSRTAARKAAAARGKASDGSEEASGEWVLVDAGWCVVHVMTPKARARYDVEGVWKDLVKEQDREDAAAAPL
ncbi:hypothetical protein BCV69DRAFT_276612 [Microstroma glucosiphilum]|uniref:Required for respiratory growth protein 9, mitochondrial n=1 Tax=Pseudomicrostroma glucosiphilum TaxID=1684307 RepID=A0A316UBN2_9BASI|nr:hypothetical protein BCV69DRAFT_276612 [Pseudomicrostroma glucosiphilum]PWN21861.1 hypothetical protein BCV69DRAFT_276612 [Pseudomicrostroma glucosiphilum]